MLSLADDSFLKSAVAVAAVVAAGENHDCNVAVTVAEAATTAAATTATADFKNESSTSDSKSY